jgi:ribosomal protein L4
MKVDVFDMEGKKVKQVELPAAVFEAPINVDLMHQAYVRQMANARLGTHETKTRSDVSGGGRKPWRQKGTGRARQGSTRAVQWKGGGRIRADTNNLCLRKCAAQRFDLLCLQRRRTQASWSWTRLRSASPRLE